jgi:hypothetical protein
MKKWLKITLAVIAVLIISLIVFVAFNYDVIKLMMGEPEITGIQSNIPEEITELTPISNGETDWLNWRGPNF